MAEGRDNHLFNMSGKTCRLFCLISYDQFFKNKLEKWMCLPRQELSHLLIYCFQQPEMNKTATL